MLTDHAIVAALEAAPARDGYAFSDVRAEEGVLSLTFSRSGAPSARLRVRLPSTGAPQWWLYAPPEDADDWALQFLVWTDEEVHTDGLGDSRERVDVDGVSHVVPTNYGWQRADPRQHARFTALAGPFGWHDGGRTAWPDGSVSVPAERELEVDDERFLISVRGSTTVITWLTGPNLGYGFSSALGGSAPEGLAARNAAHAADDERMRRELRSFLAEIDPETGYLGD